jgi:tRNA-Thr(GGU) m(6)t(6)A37 methyltransferase TsaA
MERCTVVQIGTIRSDAEGMRVELEREYIPALEGLAGFSHLQILWWFSESDTTEARRRLQERSPYKGAPAVMGIFATRSPNRPNPLALSCAELLSLDYQRGILHLAYIDALDGSPVLDLKPYTPSLDRVERPGVPSWCGNWPKSLEESGSFDWDSVFTFSES